MKILNLDTIRIKTKRVNYKKTCAEIEIVNLFKNKQSYVTGYTIENGYITKEWDKTIHPEQWGGFESFINRFVDCQHIISINYEE